MDNTKKQTDKRETDKEKTERLEGYIPILRGLINYHKRMTIPSAPCYFSNSETGEWEHCKTAEKNNRKCPKITVMNDTYLGALEESLRLIEKEIALLKRV